VQDQVPAKGGRGLAVSRRVLIRPRSSILDPDLVDHDHDLDLDLDLDHALALALAEFEDAGTR
jgi:hypothetical protein